MTVRIGTRASNLAMWQATTVLEALERHGIEAELVPLSSTLTTSFPLALISKVTSI